MTTERKSHFGLPITSQDLRVFGYLRPHWKTILVTHPKETKRPAFAGRFAFRELFVEPREYESNR